MELLQVMRNVGTHVIQNSSYDELHFWKNSKSLNVDESRRFSCGSIVSRRLSMSGLRRNEIPVENIYSQNKIDTLQWQLKEIDKSREMYKAVMKQVVTFLEKAHISLGTLGSRLNRKNTVPRSKSEHHIVIDNNTQSQRSLIEEHLNTWNNNKKDVSPDEIPPEKLAQEAFRLLRTAQSLLSTQEPNLTVSENGDSSDGPTDIEFLAQLAKEFPSDSQKQPQRATSFSLTPKLILPEHDIRIGTAFNRKLSLQLNDVKRTSPGKYSRCDSARGSVAESESFSLSGVERLEKSAGAEDPMREMVDFLETRSKNGDKSSSSPPAGSISSMEDESGFSSMTSFQDVGLPLVNSTAIDEVSPRSIFLKSILHESDESSVHSERTLLASPSPDVDLQKRSEYINAKEVTNHDVKLWQKPSQDPIRKNASANSLPSHKRWHSNPVQTEPSEHSLKVLWV
ncbi:uncharacterized protein LOC115880900 isoform X2 [Sitophilus oryzae]|uniref:Uncharacterized protein LOC115880900 isoform X2 n=1 Tax=Sitophilus oryzae TaxID=7048 RepID=A0A6J2XRM7_SITOR|nr:uncharacterized protein LOC115880900 isoform X2 [Sitophilus oryzae]